MKKLTDEELSRVLTAHELDGLRRMGNLMGPAYPCCLFQAAEESLSGHFRGLSDHVRWFDGEYLSWWTVDEFLAQLEARGLA